MSTREMTHQELKEAYRKKVIEVTELKAKLYDFITKEKEDN